MSEQQETIEKIKKIDLNLKEETKPQESKPKEEKQDTMLVVYKLFILKGLWKNEDTEENYKAFQNWLQSKDNNTPIQIDGKPILIEKEALKNAYTLYDKLKNKGIWKEQSDNIKLDFKLFINWFLKIGSSKFGDFLKMPKTFQNAVAGKLFNEMG